MMKQRRAALLLGTFVLLNLRCDFLEEEEASPLTGSYEMVEMEGQPLPVAYHQWADAQACGFDERGETVMGSGQLVLEEGGAARWTTYEYQRCSGAEGIVDAAFFTFTGNFRGNVDDVRISFTHRSRVDAPGAGKQGNDLARQAPPAPDDGAVSITLAGEWEDAVLVATDEAGTSYTFEKKNAP